MTATYKLQVRVIKYFICTYQGHMGTFMPNMKFLCVTLWLGGVCTDANNYVTNGNSANDDDT